MLTKAGQDLLHSVASAWRTAQERAKVVLGENGVTAVMEVGNDIFFPSTA